MTRKELSNHKEQINRISRARRARIRSSTFTPTRRAFPKKLTARHLATAFVAATLSM